MALPGWLATAAGLLLFLTRYLRISNQAAIIAATFAHLAPVSMFIGAVLLALGGNPGSRRHCANDGCRCRRAPALVAPPRPGRAATARADTQCLARAGRP